MTQGRFEAAFFALITAAPRVFLDRKTILIKIISSIMEKWLKSAARRYLPPWIRQRLGSLAGRIYQHLIQPSLGLVFDLKGGRFRANGCEFVIPKDITTRSFRACFLRNTHECDERALIERLVRPDDQVIELGACLGIVSCVTNQRLRDRSRHVVIEANPLCIPALYRNREINNAGFLIDHCAIHTASEATFYLHPKFIVGGSVQRPTDYQVRLPAKSLRQLELERGPFNVLIMDIEGSEREAFEDSLDLFRHYRLVIVELHEWAIGEAGVERCRQILRESGMTFVERSGIVEAWRRNPDSTQPG